MYVKIEPSGCCEYKGTVQVRFSMFLEPDDYGYEIHHIGDRDNPFHNHFILLDPSISDEEIKDIAEALLQEAYIKWACGEPIDIPNLPFNRPTITDKRISDCVRKAKLLREKWQI